MAIRRMLSRAVVDSDAFLDLPVGARLLYYDMVMRADDDGMVDGPRKIMRMVGATQSDLDALLESKYVLMLTQGIVVIRHWYVHNSIRHDRYTPTIYTAQRSMLQLGDDKVYHLLPEGATPPPPAKQTKAKNVNAILDDFAAKHPQDGLRTALHDYMQHRADKGKPLTALAAKKLLDKLAADIAPEGWVAAINNSIANGWVAIYAPEGGGRDDGSDRHTTATNSYGIDGTL